MVRHKARWLLVHFDFQEPLNVSDFPSKKDFALMIRQSISSCFGIAADGASMETQVRLVDPSTRLILLRVPRDCCNLVRCSLTMLTNTSMATSKRPTMVASVVSVNGSARTAKLATMSRVKKYYRKQLLLLNWKGEKQRSPPRIQSMTKDLEKILRTIQNID